MGFERKKKDSFGVGDRWNDSVLGDKEDMKIMILVLILTYYMLP